MFGNFSYKIAAQFTRHKWLFFLVFCSVVVSLIYGLNSLRINQDLYGIFPKGEEFKGYQELLTKNNINNQLVFSLNYDEEDGPDQVDRFHRELESNFSAEIAQIRSIQEVDESMLLKQLQQRAILALSDADYSQFESKITADSLSKSLRKNKDRLVGISGWYTKLLIQHDPYGLLSGKLKQLNPQKQQRFVLKDGYLLSADEKQVFVFGKLTIPSKLTNQLKEFDSKLKIFVNNWNSNKSNAKASSFGTYEIAVANADRIQKDTWLTSIISIAGILVLILLFYRSLWAPIYFVLPAMFGILSGVGLMGYVRPDVNGMAIATASVLLGIVLDYTFHFFTHLKETGSALKTVRSIANPMILGSFTTLVALGSLMFTTSSVLQDFGLIAIFTLGGSVVFTLLFLPVFVTFFPPKFKEGNSISFKTRKLVKLTSFGLLVGTIYWLFSDISVPFDADINHLGYHPSELKKKEEMFTGLDPNDEKKLVVFVQGNQEESVRSINDQLFNYLSSEDTVCSEVQSLSLYLPAKTTITSGGEQWSSFWSKHPEVNRHLDTASMSLGFNKQAFAPFLTSQHHAVFDTNNGQSLVNQLGLDALYEKDTSGKVTYMTLFRVKKDQLERIKSEIRKLEMTFVLDTSDLARSMLSAVKDDFNYLLLFSSALVFLTLLVVYGRIELTLLAFAPMVLSWLWILGISHLAGLSFNFINILVATFVFGLGDDFSIFTVDGLIQRSKTGENHLASSQKGIILSGISTIIGTGAMIFAVHPSIHSIGWISIIGIGVVMLLTLVMQPQVFQFFVFKRKEKNRGPVTFFAFIYSIFLFTYFLVGSVLINLFLIFILIPFPAKKSKKRLVLNYLISNLAKSTLYVGLHVKKVKHDFEKLNPQEPKILVANHSSFLDILVILMLHPKTIIMVKKWVYQSPVFGLFIRYAGYLFIEEGVNHNAEIVKERIKEGYSIAIFPEGSRSDDGVMKRFHKGSFLLAQELNVKIQPVLILGTHEVNAKNDFMINAGEIHVRVLEETKHMEEETYQAYTKRIQHTMREEMQRFHVQYAQTSFFQRKVLENYLLKGPVLEWYVRIKWMLERKNYAYYDALIGDRLKILDLGTGYGYFPLYLHYRNRARFIGAMDYDSEKIALASGCNFDANQLQFQAGDVRSFTFGAQDVIVFQDILHYLHENEQFEVLKRCVDCLEPNGMILIRDGIVELSERNKRTKLTEFFSTKVLRFNKTTNDLHFISSEKISKFAKNHDLSFELIDHSKHTSNVLMILKKPE
jgi:1-acyl-sn-glycerol-3-phosphate acyltransferase